MGYLIVGIILLVLIGLVGSAQKDKKEEILTKNGYKVSQRINSGRYVAGHPNLDKPLKLSTLIVKDQWLNIFEYPNGYDNEAPVHRAGIQLSAINNVLIEDETTVERKVTVGRLLLVGVFAFALKKKKVNELAYLTIQWKDNKFEHETYFEFEGKDAMQKANTARNGIIKLIN